MFILSISSGSEISDHLSSSQPGSFSGCTMAPPLSPLILSDKHAAQSPLPHPALAAVLEELKLTASGGDRYSLLGPQFSRK